MKRVLTLLLLVAALLAPAAYAITYGNPDGNRHPAVGGLVDVEGRYVYCSGTLISSTVFLTAAHCVEEGERVCVTFESQYTAKSRLYCGVAHSHPGYYGGSNNPLDVAVVVFGRAIRGIQPATVVSENLLSEMKADGTLTQKTWFTSVGYGGQEMSPPYGQNATYTYLDRREYVVGYYNALGPGYLKISQNPAAGSGGTCYGDSGGPQFLYDTNVVVSLTVTGDVFCKSTNVDQRLDIPEVQDFLALYVEL